MIICVLGLVRVSQNVKFLYCASIFIGNLPVSALHALLRQYLFTPSNHFNHFKNLHISYGEPGGGRGGRAGVVGNGGAAGIFFRYQIPRMNFSLGHSMNIF